MTRNVHGDVWLSFCHFINAKIKLDLPSSEQTNFAVKQLDTVYIKEPPTQAEIVARFAESDILSDALRSWSLYSAPVYMVTGLKIARGFSMMTSTSSTRQVETGTGVTLTPDMSVSGGGDLGLSFQTKISKDVTSLPGSENDIVFAYKHLLITTKGWKEKHVVPRDYEPRGAFSNSSKPGAHSDEQEIVLLDPTLKAIQVSSYFDDVVITGDDGCPNVLRYLQDQA